jgi:hypothetical protein
MITPMGCVMVGLLVAGAAWLAVCLSALAKRRSIDTGLLARAIDQIGQGRCAELKDRARADTGWTSRMIARAVEGTAGKPTDILAALPEVFMADFARLRGRIGLLRAIGVAGVAAGIVHVLSRSPAPAADAVPAAARFAAADLFDPATVALFLLILLLVSGLPLKNEATLLALRARQEIGTLLARARATTPAGN